MPKDSGGYHGEIIRDGQLFDYAPKRKLKAVAREFKVFYMKVPGKTEEAFVIPNSDAGVLNTLYRNATVNEVEYGDENIRVRATVDAKVRGMLRDYLAEEK